MMRVFLGLGSNIGNREANLRLALQWLEPSAHIVAVSSLYRSPALVLEGDEPGPDFLNAACEIETGLSPTELLTLVKEIENRIGRRPSRRWAPRPIDIDILLYGDTSIESTELTMPHPFIAERNFVLLPLAELASDVTHPALGVTIGELAEAVDFDDIEHIAGPEWVDGSTAPADEEADE
jgi:2-amino-4-hydroxy-6-hydroxymethyldihydropteridine diphosphokinase